jgi:hypothetical protein
MAAKKIAPADVFRAYRVRAEALLSIGGAGRDAARR